MKVNIGEKMSIMIIICIEVYSKNSIHRFSNYGFHGFPRLQSEDI